MQRLSTHLVHWIAVTLFVGCGGATNSPVADTGTDTEPTDCRPVTHVKLTGDPIRLPCEQTEEPCDGEDNDQDGIIDPHCPIACQNHGDCTADGWVLDAACVDGVCGSIHSIPAAGDHSSCAGVLCPPANQCVEGTCVLGGEAAVGDPCTSGSLCALGTGCTASASEPGGLMGQCVAPCTDGDCAAGYLCVSAGAANLSTVCSQRYFCEGAVDECQESFLSCKTDADCAAVLACLETEINALSDTNPYEPSVVLLGMAGSPLAACWAEATDNAAAADWQACLEKTCASCFDCTDKVCGDDGCGGSCGACAIGTVCTDYLRSDQVGTLAPGQCVCLPNCIDRDCGDDGCGGSCGTCEQENTVCSEDGKCVCWPTCEGRECGADGCGVPCGFCDDGETCTAEGQCLCVPDCEGKSCGHDGCEGNCGTCDDPNMVCDDGVGQCVCFPTCEGKTCGVDGCGNSCGECPQGTGCGPEGQCGCFPTCDGKQCGLDGCGVSCGTCPTGQECNGAGTCECVANCTNKDCGDDGCGVSCGSCGAGETCSMMGTCMPAGGGSCAGLCAVPDANADCKCDASCFTLGDCCSDICAVCGLDFTQQCAGM